MNILSTDQCSYDISPARLKACSIFGALSDESINFLLTEASLQEYEKEEAIFSLGENSDCFYIVIEGSVGLFKLSADGKNMIDFGIAEVHFGEGIGYVTMIALKPRNTNTRALEKTLLLKVDAAAFHKFHDTFAFDFGIFILNLSRDIARKVHILSGTMADAELTVSKPKS